MKVCKKCGTQLPDEAKFCAKCGTPVAIEDKAPSKTESKQPTKPATSITKSATSTAMKSNGSSSNSSSKGMLVFIVIVAVVVVAVIAIVNSNSGSSYSPTSTSYQSPSTNTQSSYTHSSSNYQDNNKTTIDKNRVKNVISEICRCSCKGGNYNSLRNYFTYEISPHPSGEIRYSNTIGDKTRSYVERFEEYSISNPSNFSFVNNSFPLTVKCDVYVTWTKNGKRKRAWIDKTYYVNSDYKVSGFTDKEIRRETIN